MDNESKKTQESIERTAETMGDTIIQVIDKLAGKQSDLKLTFQDLTLDAAGFKAKLNGAIVLDVTMAKDIESPSYKAT